MGMCMSACSSSSNLKICLACTMPVPPRDFGDVDPTECRGSRFGYDGLNVGFLYQARSVFGSRSIGALARGLVAESFRRGTCPRTYTNSRRQGSCDDATHHLGGRGD